MDKIEWEKANCPICGIEYSYIKGGYKPKTCNQFDCLYAYNHPEAVDARKKRLGGK